MIMIDTNNYFINTISKCLLTLIGGNIDPNKK